MGVCVGCVSLFCVERVSIQYSRIFPYRVLTSVLLSLLLLLLLLLLLPLLLLFLLPLLLSPPSSPSAQCVGQVGGQVEGAEARRWYLRQSIGRHGHRRRPRKTDPTHAAENLQHGQTHGSTRGVFWYCYGEFGEPLVEVERGPCRCFTRGDGGNGEIDVFGDSVVRGAQWYVVPPCVY